MAAVFEIWRDCSRKSCRRSRCCSGPCVATCLSDWSSRNIDDVTRAFLHVGVQARAAGASVEEACAVAEALATRMEAEHAALAPECEAGRAARIRVLREDERLSRGIARPLGQGLPI